MDTIIALVLIFGTIFLLVIAFKKTIGSAKPEVERSGDFEVLEIKMLRGEAGVADFKTSALAAEHFFASLHGLLEEDSHLQDHFSFEMISDQEKGIRFLVVVPRELVRFIEGQIYAQFPTSQISVVPDYTSSLSAEGSFYQIASILATKEDFFPIKSFRDFELDPLSNITTVLSQVEPDQIVGIQLLIKPIPDVWQKAGHDYIKNVREGTQNVSGPSILGTAGKILAKEAFGFTTSVLTGLFRYNEAPKEATKASVAVKLTPQQDLELNAVENKLTRMGYRVEMRIYSCAKHQEDAETTLKLLTSSYQQYTTTFLNGLSAKVYTNKESLLNKFITRTFEDEHSFVMNVEELASIYHFPSKDIDTPNISWIYSRKTEPPVNLPTNDCVYIGETVFRGKAVKFGLKNNDDRLRHMYVIGKSGTGKSSLFESMIGQDMVNGYGLGILDPHGETIDKILEVIPDNRVDDVIYFDPSDVDTPIGLNLLQIDDPSQKNILASGLLGAIKAHFEYSWGPRLEYLLNYCLLTLLEVPGTTMLAITRLLEDDNYLKFILHYVKDPMLVRFWETEFKEFKGNQKLVTEAIAPIQNKVNRFLASSTIRNILGQKTSTLNIWDAMQSGKILLMNLSKGKIGSDNANLLGALLVSRLQFYALQRARIHHTERRPFLLYVDEFQNFASGSFEEILSESRKYGLGLYLTHQFTAQLPEELLKAVYGNVGTIATFSLGAPDARSMGSEFAPYFDQEDIISLERFQIYIKMMIDGMTSLPFSARTFRPWIPEESMIKKTGNRERVIEASRAKYGVKREYVEEKLSKWLTTKFDKGMAIALELKNKKGDGLHE